MFTPRINLFILTTPRPLALIALYILLPVQLFSQNIFIETVGTTATTTIGTVTVAQYSGWQNGHGYTMTGNASVCTCSNLPASNQPVQWEDPFPNPAPSGGAAIAFPAVTTWEMSGINTSAATNPSLSFYIYKNSNVETGAQFFIEVSADGATWTSLSIPLFPSGGGTVGWYSRTATGTIPSVSNLHIRFSQMGSNNFFMDDIRLSGVSCTPPSDPAVTDGSRCGPGTVTLSASGSGPDYIWYDAPTGGATLATTTGSFTTPAISASTTYYVSAILAGCESGRIPVNATVTPLSQGGSVTSGATVCAGSNDDTLILSGHTGSVIRWEGSQDNFTTPGSPIENLSTTLIYSNLTETTSYRAIVQSGSCSTANSASVTITVSPVSAGGTVSADATTCAGSNLGTLTLSGHTGTVMGWESSPDNFATAGSPVVNTSTNLSFSNLTQTASYRAIVQSGVCPAAYSTSATITVQPVPASPSATDASADNPGTVTLSATGSSGTYSWYDVPSGGSPLDHSTVFTTPFIGQTTTYYVASAENGCESPRIPVQAVIINPSTELKIYESLSPNGDGINDEWIIDRIELYPSNHLKIFDRWGYLVYEMKNYDNTGKVWKGESNTSLMMGKELPRDTYYYILEIKEGKNPLSGFVILNR